MIDVSQIVQQTESLLEDEQLALAMSYGCATMLSPRHNPIAGWTCWALRLIPWQAKMHKLGFHVQEVRVKRNANSNGGRCRESFT